MCVWYTELTCISNGVSKTDIVVGKVQCVCVCVDRWRGHSRCRAPLTTGVDIYPKVLPSAYCVLLAHKHTHKHWTLPTTMSVLETPLQGALNHWGRILPQGPTIQNNQLKKRVCVKILDFDLSPPPPPPPPPPPLAWTLGSGKMK